MILKNSIKKTLITLLNRAPIIIANQILALIEEARPTAVDSICREVNPVRLSKLTLAGLKRFEILSENSLSNYLKTEISTESWEWLKLPKVTDISSGGGISIRARGIRLFKFDNAVFQPYSDFVRLGNSVYWDKENRFQLVKTIPMDQDLFRIDRANNAAYLKDGLKKRKFGTVFSLCGVHVNSWGHFIGNFFPKIATLGLITDESSITVIMPIDVDEHIKELTENSIGKYENFKVCYVERTESVECERLYYCTSPSFISDHALYIHPSDVHLTNWALEQIFKLTQAYRGNISNIDNRCRLFLSRRGGRNLENIEAIEDLFLKNGYQIVFPHKLSLKEKISLFARATHVAGPYSSGFANVVFCQPGTCVLALCNYSRLLDGYVAAFEGGQFGLNVTMLTGTEKISSDPHNSYMVPIDRIEKLLKYFHA